VMAEDSPVNFATVAPYVSAGSPDPVIQAGNNADPVIGSNTGRAVNRWAEPDKSVSISGPSNSTAGNLKNIINDNSTPAGGPADCKWSSGDCGPSGEIFSLHPGGAHVLLCDGSTLFLAENVDFRTLRCLLTRDEGVPTPTYQ